MATAILIGMPEDLANQLSRVLREEAHRVGRREYTEFRPGAAPDVVFLYGDAAYWSSALSWLRESQPRTPVVLVTRLPESRRWLDALDQGARDYCCAPFTRADVRWILHSVCPQASLPAAA